MRFRWNGHPGLSLTHHALQDAVEKSYSADGQERAGESHGG
jgi:hypothetical protein